MIRVRDLTKRYGSFVAVERLSFEVGRGEIVGFLGPNGAGKTTTLRVLTGFQPATSGTAELAGMNVASDSLGVRRQLGYLPQEVPIYPDLRVIEYLRYRAALKGVPAKARAGAVARAMDKAGIVDVGHKLVGHVSHGYRQRVGLADALVANPPILILDEPTSGLDPNQRRRIKQVVRDLANEHTVLFSSHILGEVQEVTSRVLVIHRGVLRADGSPAELVARGASRRLRVAVRGEPGALASALAAGGIAADVVVGDGLASAVAELPAGADPVPALAAALAARALPVHELRVELPTLEEWFHAVTEGADRGEEAAAAAQEAGR
ncbi:MAG: ABC transporter ATP-binding protein [Planctomycetes bacterium]|nr:ABC transporter ATP-binding protein [Planctomycetota bacterium]